MSAGGTDVQPGAGGPPLVSHQRAAHGPELAASLDCLVAPFGGWAAIVSPGEKIAVKVNLLRGAAPEKAVSTHPETLRAVLLGWTRCSRTQTKASIISPNRTGWWRAS